MNRCARRGYLVDGTHAIPTDPTDLQVENLPVVGCSKLHCSACGARVRNAQGMSFATPRDLSPGELKELYATTDLASSPLIVTDSATHRLYLCRCRRWLETSSHACKSSDPDDSSEPDMPWSCEGHPELVLPHDLDGTNLTAGNLAEVVELGFHGDAPPRMRPADVVRAEWIARLHGRLSAGHAKVVTTAALAALADPAPRTRALALHYCHVLELEQAHVLELFERSPALFTGVADEVTTVSGDATLAHTVWTVVAPLLGEAGRARELARELALAGNANVAAYYALAKHDGAWVASHVEDLARAAPARAKELSASLSQLPPTFRIKDLRDRVRKIAS